MRLAFYFLFILVFYPIRCCISKAYLRKYQKFSSTVYIIFQKLQITKNLESVKIFDKLRWNEEGTYHYNKSVCHHLYEIWSYLLSLIKNINSRVIEGMLNTSIMARRMFLQWRKTHVLKNLLTDAGNGKKTINVGLVSSIFITLDKPQIG